MKPTIGRIVHYTSEAQPDTVSAALVTFVDPGGVTSLAVFSTNGMYYLELAPHADKPTPGHWNWPPREPTPERQPITVDRDRRAGYC